MIEAIYLDTCVLNRPSDDHRQPRIKAEAEALGRILDLVHLGRARWYSSTAVRYEIDQNPDSLRRIRALDLLTSAYENLSPQPASVAEAARLTSLGFTSLDALHLALAHEASADWLITTDRFLRTAARQLQGYRPHVVNPVDWLQRMQPWLLQPQSP
jgi:predicted nucleic acid-binding protein